MAIARIIVSIVLVLGSFPAEVFAAQAQVSVVQGSVGAANGSAGAVQVQAGLNFVQTQGGAASLETGLVLEKVELDPARSEPSGAVLGPAPVLEGTVLAGDRVLQARETDAKSGGEGETSQVLKETYDQAGVPAQRDSPAGSPLSGEGGAEVSGETAVSVPPEGTKSSRGAVPLAGAKAQGLSVPEPPDNGGKGPGGSSGSDGGSRAPNPSHRVTAWIFDVDNNIFKKLPTKIILFHKTSGDEKPVTTEEFALIREQIGKAGPYKDYEVRRDPTTGSYRRFNDTSGGNPFLEDVQFAVRNWPKSEWQGPSWDAFAYALSREDTAAWVGVLTARGHSGESILEAFKFLKEEGYLKYLPKTERLHGVGHAEDPSASKVEEMIKTVDQIQESPLGPDAPKVLDADGKGKKAMHLVGFSDDDWGNFQTMAKGLAKQVRKSEEHPKGRWPDVKITLIYTGPEARKQEPGAYVLTPEGKLRPLTTDEHGEAYIEHLERPGGYRAPRFKPLPYPTVVRSKLASVDETIEAMYVSHPFDSKDPKVAAGDDVLARERQAILDFINDESIPASRKRVILKRYSIEDEDLAAAMMLAKEKKVPFTLITDFNVSMEFAFKEGQDKITDFSKAKIKDSSPGLFIQTILGAGYKIHDKNAKWVIYSQPLYNKGDPSIDPIMHEKSLLLVVEPAPGQEASRRIAYYYGTANLTRHPRYNRVFKVNEELTAQHALEHSEAMVQAFLEGKTIEEIESVPPLRVYFEDESFMETAFTNGKYNPNERLVVLFERAAREPEKFQIEEVVFSHFVLTNGNVVDSLKEAMKVQPGFRVQGVFDEKFISVRGYGKAAVLDGFMTFPPMGRMSRGWSYELRKRTNLFGYLRGIDGAVETDIEGPPLARHLWHDKTSMVYVVEDGVRWAYVLTGSLNNSNHFENAEMQVLYRFRADSPWPKAFRDSILKVAEKEGEHALPMESQVLRGVVARLIGHSPLEVTLESLRVIQEAFKSRNLKGQGEELRKLSGKTTTLEKGKLAPEAMEENIQRILGFIEWYNTKMLAAGLKKFPLSLQKAAALATVVASPEMKPYEARSALDFVFWEPDLPGPKLEKQIEQAWKALGLKGVPPRARPPKASGSKGTTTKFWAGALVGAASLLSGLGLSERDAAAATFGEGLQSGDPAALLTAVGAVAAPFALYGVHRWLEVLRFSRMEPMELRGRLSSDKARHRRLAIRTFLKKRQAEFVASEFLRMDARDRIEEMGEAEFQRVFGRSFDKEPGLLQSAMKDAETRVVSLLLVGLSPEEIAQAAPAGR